MFFNKLKKNFLNKFKKFLIFFFKNIVQLSKVKVMR